MTTSSHIFGINWMRYHPDNWADLDHIRRAGYRWILLYQWMWSDKGFCEELLANVPADCQFILRDHPLSEQKEDMYRAPVETGIRHAADWAMKYRDGKIFIPKDRCYVQGINEPDSNGNQAAIDTYTTEFATLLASDGIRCAGWVFGTGHPSTVDLKPENPVDWHWYASSAKALNDFGGIADFHAYGSYDDMPWDDHLARMQTCPYKLPCVISEFGIDEGIKGNHGQGWRVNLTTEKYAAWLNTAQVELRERLSRSNLDLQGLLIFCYDYNSDWKSFDIRDNRFAFETVNWHSPAAKPVPAPPQAPATTKPTLHMPYVQVPEAPRGPVDGDFERSLEFVLGKEGGYSSDPNDKGNYDDEGNFVGTKYGISGRVWGDHYDIANLTMGQAVEIYREHYWRLMGCNNRRWPTCLLLFDTAVQHGVGAAKTMEKEAGAPGEDWNLRFFAARLRFYANADSWHYHGQGWILRISSLMQEMTK